jgi:hypothetical protein
MTEQQNRQTLIAFISTIDIDEVYASDINEAGGLANYMFAWLYADEDNKALCEADGFPADKMMPILNMDGALELVLKMADKCRAEYEDEESEDYSYELARERACYERGF